MVYFSVYVNQKFTNMLDNNIDSQIIGLLAAGSKRTTELLENVLGKGKVTRQAFYKALRKLLKENVLVVHKKQVSLSRVWANNLRKLAKQIENAYFVDLKIFDFTNLKEGEKIKYTFNTIRNLDNFWGQAQNTLMQYCGNDEAIYSYDPHYWFYLVRQDIEKELLREISERHIKFLMTVGGNTFLDKFIKKDFNNKYLQYNIKKIFPEDNFYLTVVGDYVIEVTLDKKVSNGIEAIFTNNKLPELACEKLALYLDVRSTNKMIIYRNAEKAGSYRKKIGKDFY